MTEATQPAGGVRGHCDPRFERVREEFERNFAERGEVGSSLCVVLDGEPVVDLWGGVADAASGRRWERDTLQVIFSSSKGLAAIVGHMLLDRGQLDLDAPIARYWPEFAQRGKADIPVRMAFNHQSGVCHVGELIPPGGLADFDLMVEMTARTAPFWEPGTRAGYHALTLGWMIGELVRRVTGRTIGTVFREEVAEPLDADVWFGLPEAHEERVARTIPFDIGLPEPPDWVPAALLDPTSRTFRTAAKAATRIGPVRRRIAAGLAAHFAANDLPAYMAEQAAEIDGLMFQLFGNMGGTYPEDCDSRAMHAAELPAAGAIGNARSLARAYAPLSIDGAIDGVRLVRPSAIPWMRSPQSAQGVDAVIGLRTAYTLGFSKSWPNQHLQDASVIIGEDAFGTPGLGGQLGFADPSCRLAFGYTTIKHGIGTALNERGQAVVDATYRALGSPGCEPGFWVRPE